jgi:hypothetical protein
VESKSFESTKSLLSKLSLRRPPAPPVKKKNKVETERERAIKRGQEGREPHDGRR